MGVEVGVVPCSCTYTQGLVASGIYPADRPRLTGGAAGFLRRGLKVDPSSRFALVRADVLEYYVPRVGVASREGKPTLLAQVGSVGQQHPQKILVATRMVDRFGVESCC